MVRYIVSGQQIGSKHLSIDFESKLRRREVGARSPRSVSSPNTPTTYQQALSAIDLTITEGRKTGDHERSKSTEALDKSNEERDRRYVKQLEKLTISSPTTKDLPRLPNTPAPRTLRPSSSRWSLPISPSMNNLLEVEGLGAEEGGDRATAAKESSPGSAAERRALRRERRRVEADHIVEVPE
ncbi:hypothetical protein B0T21DRAFT_397666 [Apiosordaria backusii]|uniref:Uncharacterized protein n=1 Tax=Apiosordaria backusii TaxID=314023 RepID=A0AA40DF36_9PEZI|nr:hypothetical protein B0T21DRAFT_397666 [Apiosordaria backusii]